MAATIDREQKTLWDTVKFLAEQHDLDKAEAVFKVTIEKSLQLMNVYTPVISDLHFSIPDKQLLNELQDLDMDIRRKISGAISEKNYEEILEYIQRISETTVDPQVANNKMLASILYKKTKQGDRLKKMTNTQFGKNFNDEPVVGVNERKKIFYTTSEAAHKLGLSDQTIRRMCESGKMRGAYRSEGGHWRIPGENFITTKKQDMNAKEILKHLDKKNHEVGDIDEFDL